MKLDSVVSPLGSPQFLDTTGSLRFPFRCIVLWRLSQQTHFFFLKLPIAESMDPLVLSKGGRETRTGKTALDAFLLSTASQAALPVLNHSSRLSLFENCNFSTNPFTASNRFWASWWLRSLWAFAACCLLEDTFTVRFRNHARDLDVHKCIGEPTLSELTPSTSKMPC